MTSPPEHIETLLTNDSLDDTKFRRAPTPVKFSNPQAAYRCLNRINQLAPATYSLAIPKLLVALNDAADPNHVLINFERLIQNTPNPEIALKNLADNPRVLEILVYLFSGSQFLTEILLKHPENMEQLTAYHQLTQQKNAEQLQAEAKAILPTIEAHLTPAVVSNLRDALRRFQKWELLRIGLSDLVGAYDLPTITSQLSFLADSLIEAALRLAAQQTRLDASDFFVIGMGKLGGQELNYSSDIDLLFIAKDNPDTYWKFGQRLIDSLAQTTAEGFLYRVDMRLRPWGQSGGLVSSVEGHLVYLEKHANLWEKQALLKARVVAGNKALGQEFLRRAHPLLFTYTHKTIQAEVRTLKEKIEEQLRRRGQQWGEVKLGQGSIRDVEFVTQYLQLVHGGKHPYLLTPTTLEALSRLFNANFLSAEAYRVLTDSYTFLRTIEHHLQLMYYQQTHTLPTEPKALTHLAQRLGYEGLEAGSEFVARYEQHSTVVRLVYEQYLGEQSDLVQSVQSTPDTLPENHLLPHISRLPAAYLATFEETDIKHHAALAQQLDADRLVIVEEQAIDNTHWQVTIVGYDYLGELSMICGLLFIHGFNIIDGHVFSYGPAAPAAKPQKRQRHRQPPKKDRGIAHIQQRKIVDVFTVHSVHSEFGADRWSNYKRDLQRHAQWLREGRQDKAQGELARQVAENLQPDSDAINTLYPVDIKIDNDSSQRHTVLQINAPDTIGFLYEFTNALALSRINIRRMTVASVGNRVQDTLYVTNAHHHKITQPEKQHELRVAIVLIKHFTHILPHSPNPQSALLHFRAFVGQLFTRPNWPAELTSLEQPEVLNRLARLLGVSDFLWNDFLRMQYENLFPVVRDKGMLATEKTTKELRLELATLLEKQGNEEAAKYEALNAFKDREMFRIDMRLIQGHLPNFGFFSGELTDLVEVVVEAAYHLAAKKMTALFGQPRMTEGQFCPMSVCALGKCGGRELGFASDIELMFLYVSSGKTDGPKVITTAEYFNKLVQEVTTIIQAKQEGIFEIDLRLRPYGKAGNMAVSFDSFQTYFASEGDAWPYERQALVRLRPIAGDTAFGQQIVAARDRMIYTGAAFDVAAMRAMRERQLRHLVTAGTINAKFSPGGLVDLEYLIQGLQITHGADYPGLRHPNIHRVMQGLVEAQVLPESDYAPLREAHIFLRSLINALRMVRGDAKDLTVPPTDSEAFAFLARRLDYPSNQIAQLREDILHYTVLVQEINSRLLD